VTALQGVLLCGFVIVVLVASRLWTIEAVLILMAFITGKSSLELLLEGLLTQIHIDLS